MKRIVTITAAVMLAAWLVAAQAPTASQAAPGTQAAQPPAKKQPQPKSKEEFDALQKLGDPALSPDQRITLAEEFLVRFPDSELKAFIYREEMRAYQANADFFNMLDFGEKVLKEDPDDPLTLIILASAIPERTRENDLDRDEKLKKAEGYANRALAMIDKLAKPSPQMPDADWDRARDDGRSQVRAALGLVALHRKQYSVAEEEFKKAAQLQGQKDPVVYWRLGLALRGAKKYEEARDAYKQAVDLGGVKVGTRDLAAEELQQVEEFLKKRQGAAGTGTTPPPPSGTTPPAGGTPPPVPKP